MNLEMSEWTPEDCHTALECFAYIGNRDEPEATQPDFLGKIKARVLAFIGRKHCEQETVLNNG